MRETGVMAAMEVTTMAALGATAERGAPSTFLVSPTKIPPVAMCRWTRSLPATAATAATEARTVVGMVAPAVPAAA